MDEVRGYMSGLGNHFQTEAIPGALPHGRNSPQRPAFGLYAELFSGTAFTAPRGENRRTWTYRIRPSATHRPFRPVEHASWRTAPFSPEEWTPNQLRWSPLAVPAEPTTFVDGVATLCAGGVSSLHAGLAAHRYAFNRSMKDEYFYNADGEMLVVPQEGGLRFLTELGMLDVEPGEIALLPRGLRFKVELKGADARGYLCENYGASFRLPELGPLGSNGLASARDFLVPVAAYEDSERDCVMTAKWGGRFWRAEQSHSPLDVVAWHGNLAPSKYALANFMVIGTVSFDHPDPSIYTVLTSPSDTPGVANADFVIFPPRWAVGEDTFRPPWYHRNVMAEFMGLIHGQYEAKPGGFVPGGASLHNSMISHGPDAESWRKATHAELAPHKIDNTMAFMFESRYALCASGDAMRSPTLQQNYFQGWQALERHFDPDGTRRK
ncbi:homogentisate 1,2-dioxygenase [Paraburkholderia sediminicola]|uniref:homogentisate 1,2-dioxygenase n=1 Tax=Paraburkholderia sediminicola TaxID=458836 RepID=UPI0038B80F75